MQVTRLRRAKLVEVGERAVRNFLRHRMTTYAAALAYRALFGLFPFVLLVVALLAVLHFDGFFRWLAEQVGSGGPRVPEPLGPAVERGQRQVEPMVRLIEQARERAGGGILSFGFAVSLYSVYVVARTLAEALDAAYEVPAGQRPGLKRSVLSVLLGPVLALASIAAAGLMLIGPRLAERLAGLVGLDEILAVLWAWLRLPVALLLLAIVLALVFRFVPNVDNLSYRLAIPGAAFAVIAWAITSLGFSFYLSNFADYGVTYGSLGVAIGLLFYLYLSASVVLLGAELNAAIYRYPGPRKSGKYGPK